MAWPATLAALSAAEQREWLEALEDTAGAWHDAYSGRRASRAQRALSVVGDDPERDVPTLEPDAWQRVCASCGEPIPEARRPSAVYCGHACQRAANGRRAA